MLNEVLAEAVSGDQAVAVKALINSKTDTDMDMDAQFSLAYYILGVCIGRHAHHVHLVSTGRTVINCGLWTLANMGR